MELFKHILTFEYFLVSMAGILIAVYFYIIRGKANGMSMIMVQMFGTMGLTFGSFGIVILFDLKGAWWIGAITMLPFMWAIYNFVIYLLKQLK